MLDLCLGSFQEEREGQGGRGLLSKAGFSSGRLAAATAESLQSCLTLCDPIDGSLPGSAIPGILQQEYWSGLPLPSPSDVLVNVKQITVWKEKRGPDL